MADLSVSKMLGGALRNALKTVDAIPSSIDPTIAKSLRQMREVTMSLALQSNPVVRASDLADLGLVQDQGGGVFIPMPDFDRTPPPRPANVKALGAVGTIIISWDSPPLGSIAYAEIWRAETDNFAAAQKVGQTPAATYPDVIGSGAVRFYWVRFVSNGGTPGEFNAQAGTRGETSYDAGYLLDVLAANPPEGSNYSPLLYVQEETIVIDGVTIPPGLYSNMAYIRALSVTNAAIANLAVDDAKIANLNAVKITAGSIDADRMSANIVTALQGKFQYLSALTASVGQLQIDTNGYIRTAGVVSYTNGVGIFMGQHNGAYAFRVGSPFPNGNGLFWDGNTLTIRGNGRFTGDITGATGTFYGTLAAQTVTADMIISKACTSLEFFYRQIGNGAFSQSFYMDHAGVVIVQTIVNFSYQASGATTFSYSANIDGYNEYQVNGNSSDASGAARNAVVTTFYYGLARGWHNVNISSSHSAANNTHGHYIHIWKSYR